MQLVLFLNLLLRLIFGFISQIMSNHYLRLIWTQPVVMSNTTKIIYWLSMILYDYLWWYFYDNILYIYIYDQQVPTLICMSKTQRRLQCGFPTIEVSQRRGQSGLAQIYHFFCGHQMDGCEILHHQKDGWNPINNGMLTTVFNHRSDFAGPSTVWKMVFLQKWRAIPGTLW